MAHILILSDDGVPSGYGRISMETNLRLTARGHSITVASLQYDGLLPPGYNGKTLPYWVGSLQGKDWPRVMANLIHSLRPDIVHVIQDAPYAITLREAPVDWSTTKFVVTTPVDGVPLYTPWVQGLRWVDGLMTISEFGVQAFGKAGLKAELCRPAVDLNIFYPLGDEERLMLRASAGIRSDQFIVGTMAMNQGRKAISLMLKAFFEAFSGDPDALYLLDMEKVSPAGWDIPSLCRQFGWDMSRLIFREDLVRRGIVNLRDRYNLLDLHMVISHREGYGIPLVESMACGIPSVALDYCSGPEIVGEGRGYLIPTIPYTVPGTWGGAEDHFPDMFELRDALRQAKARPYERKEKGERSAEWARSWNWDQVADVVHNMYQKVLS